MLVIRRRIGEAILIGPDVEIEVMEISPTRVRLAVNAPREVAVMRKEARTVAVANRRAAGFAGGAGEVLRLLGAAGGNEEPGGNQEEAPQNRPKESRDSADKD